MRVLVDEAMPVQVLEPLRLNKGRALRRSKLHHIGIQQGRSAQGIRGMARVIASVVAAMPYVLDELHKADGQRVVEMSLLKAARRHDVFDPQLDVARFPYWH
jgi:hypothetical protein